MTETAHKRSLKVPSEDPYENAYLGAFLYALGYEAGKNGSEPTLCPNNHQQTPFDPCWADLSITDGDSGFLIEFKRDRSNRCLSAETEKADLIRAAGGEPPLKDLAHKCHFLGYGELSKRDNQLRPSDLWFGQYLDVVPGKPKPLSPPKRMEGLIREILEKRCGLPIPNFLEYLRRLAELMARAYNAQHPNATPLDPGTFVAAAMQGAAVIWNRSRLYALPFQSLPNLRGMLGELGADKDPTDNPPDQGGPQEGMTAKPQQVAKQQEDLSAKLTPMQTRTSNLNWLHQQMPPGQIHKRQEPPTMQME